MTKKIALLSLVAVALVAVPAGLAARHETPKPGTPAALAAKLKLKTLAAQKFTRLYTLTCRTKVTTEPADPKVTRPICLMTGRAIVGDLQKLDRAIQAKLAKAKSGTEAAKLLRALHLRVGKVIAGVQTAVALAPGIRDRIVPLPGSGNA
jgi:hypothetical protein